LDIVVSAGIIFEAIEIVKGWGLVFWSRMRQLNPAIINR